MVPSLFVLFFFFLNRQSRKQHTLLQLLILQTLTDSVVSHMRQCWWKQRSGKQTHIKRKLHRRFGCLEVNTSMFKRWGQDRTGRDSRFSVVCTLSSGEQHDADVTAVVWTRSKPTLFKPPFLRKRNKTCSVCLFHHDNRPFLFYKKEVQLFCFPYWLVTRKTFPLQPDLVAFCYTWLHSDYNTV